MPHITNQEKALHAFGESEPFYRDLLQGLYAPVYVCDTLGYVRLYNPAAAKLWGNEPQIGKDKWCGSYKIFRADGSIMPLGECPMAVVIKGQTVVDNKEVIIERPDGVRISVLPHPRVIKNSKGTIIGAINMLEDMTVLKNSEQKLRERVMLQLEEAERFATHILESKSHSMQLAKEAEVRTREFEIVSNELDFQNDERVKRVAELAIETIFQNREKEKRANELAESRQKLAFQSEKTAELLVTNGELSFQNREKEKRASELIIANGELAFQNGEKIKRASELLIANDELAFQNSEKGKRAAELIIANGELAFQNDEKEKRAAELIIANIELVFQNAEKEKRAAELAIANRELVFQNREKEKRAAELIIANHELAFQNAEKGKRASELVFANGELAFQVGEKEKREAELIIANEELDFQNKEKGKRAAELSVANKELAFQNEEKEKRAGELVVANERLETFNYVSSHDLQEPLRKIQMLSSRILDMGSENFAVKAKEYIVKIQSSASRMRSLIEDLLAFSRLNVAERKFEETDLNTIVEEVESELHEMIEERNVTIETTGLCKLKIIRFQFYQIMYNLISNALKFSKPDASPHITITSSIGLGKEFNDARLSTQTKYCHIAISDNGIGFEPEHKDRIFEVFQRLHGATEYAGTGIGLAIVKRAVDNHNGFINAIGAIDKGATFNIYIPVSQE